MKLTKSEKRKQDIQNDLKKRLKGFDHRTVGTRELLKYAIKEAVLYKYQKYLLLTEIIALLDEGELQY